MPEILSSLSKYAWLVIVIIALVHFVLLFTVLDRRRKRQEEALRAFLRNAVRELPAHSDEHTDRSVLSQIDSFIQDIREAMAPDSRVSPDTQTKLCKRLWIKDETKPYLTSLRTEKWLGVSRAATGCYSILGILGTILAIWVGIHPATTQVNLAASNVDSEHLHAAAEIVQAFAGAINSTLVGLICAVIFLLCDAWKKPSFDRLAEHQRTVRETVGTAKNYLMMSNSG